MATVNVDQLANEVLKELEVFHNATEEVVKKAVERSSKLTVAELNSTSPVRKRGGGAYAKSWAVKKDKKLTGKFKYSTVVYSKSPHYRLTHLLEFGHASRNGGRVKAQVHISPAEESAAKNLRLYIEEGIKAIGNDS